MREGEEMLTIEIQSVGPKIKPTKDNFLILFKDDAPDSIKEVALIHNYQGDFPADYLKVGAKISFGQSQYTITKVGDLVTANLNEIGHTVFYFQDVPGDEAIMHNGIYLSPAQTPSLLAGDKIIFH